MKKVLLIGDSISLYYAPFLSSYLDGVAELHTKEGRRQAFTDLDRPTGGNGGDSSMVLAYLQERDAADNLDVDLFVFNCGLHDIKRDFATGSCQIDSGAYRENVENIVKLMKKRNIPTVFITSTPVEDARHNAVERLGFKRFDADMEQYNRLALSVMENHQIPVIDLGGFTAKLSGEIYIDHVHFSEEVRKLHAAFIAGRLAEWL
ncbi:MAG: SGNH/GDSL hydrolase family protein [Clostridia bacterium]|nr:SGNH/GDSL hydrolase family protein [Clostridia bacterium]